MVSLLLFVSFATVLVMPRDASGWSLTTYHLSGRCRQPITVMRRPEQIASAIHLKPLDKNGLEISLGRNLQDADVHMPKHVDNNYSLSASSMMIALLPIAVALFAAAPAEATTTVANQVASAFAAYGHYLGLLLMTASLVVERLTIKPNMSDDEDTRLLVADTVYGIAALLTLYTGSLRLFNYGKGLDFYLHEPIFWVKMWLFAVVGASSLFNTFKIIQREFFSGSGNEPMSDKLAERMTKIVNAELLAISSIPLAATIMSRGIGYNESIPWQIGAAITAVIFVGLGGKYAVEAVTWEEDS